MRTATAGRFPGFGADAPLDLGNLSPQVVAGVVSRLHDGSADDFSRAAARVGFCSHPVRLTGSSSTVDATTGEVIDTFHSADQPLGVLLRPCGNRRADVCAACSRTYARDMFEVIRTGLLGGKTVPATVGNNPLVFATLTAPSFGHVHGVRAKGGQKVGGRCRPFGSGLCEHGRPKSCHRVHTADDASVGSPLCWDCYDWAGAVVWQYRATELWRRFTIALRRDVAQRLGVAERSLRDHASVQYAKVAEFQARGLVHFHALVRLDGPEGPGTPAPLDGTHLADAVAMAARSVRVDAPPVDGADVSRRLRFGVQLDVRTVRTGRPDDDGDVLHPEQVAAYLAKYSTKSTGVDPASPRPHLSRLVRECRYLADRAATSCRELGTEPEEDADGCVCGSCRDSHYNRLAKWSRMLGFPGHFASKSRRYSVTLGKLRQARVRFQRLAAAAARDGVPMDTADLEARLLEDDEETTLVVGAWNYVGSGWWNDGDKALADAAATRAREYAQWKAHRDTPPTA